MFSVLMNMRDRLLPKLVAIRNSLSEADRSDGEAKLVWITNEILELSRIAREEGLLALEDASGRYTD